MKIEEFAKIINIDINITYSVKNRIWYCDFEGITGSKDNFNNIVWNIYGKGTNPIEAINNFIRNINNKEINHKYLENDEQTRFFNVPELELYK